MGLVMYLTYDLRLFSRESLLVFQVRLSILK